MSLKSDGKKYMVLCEVSGSNLICMRPLCDSECFQSSDIHVLGVTCENHPIKCPRLVQGCLKSVNTCLTTILSQTWEKCWQFDKLGRTTDANSNSSFSKWPLPEIGKIPAAIASRASTKHKAPNTNTNMYNWRPTVDCSEPEIYSLTARTVPLDYFPCYLGYGGPCGGQSQFHQPYTPVQKLPSVVHVLNAFEGQHVFNGFNVFNVFAVFDYSSYCVQCKQTSFEMN